jgi:hypothetical protein
MSVFTTSKSTSASRKLEAIDNWNSPCRHLSRGSPSGMSLSEYAGAARQLELKERMWVQTITSEDIEGGCWYAMPSVQQRATTISPEVVPANSIYDSIGDKTRHLGWLEKFFARLIKCTQPTTMRSAHSVKSNMTKNLHCS